LRIFSMRTFSLCGRGELMRKGRREIGLDVRVGRATLDLERPEHADAA